MGCCRSQLAGDPFAWLIASKLTPTKVGALKILGLSQLTCHGHIHRYEAHPVTGLELAELPEVCLDNGHWTDKAAEARAVRAEDDRHVAGEVHGADGVRVVVDVRGVKAGLAAAVTHPLGLRSYETNAGAAGVEMHRPVGGEEALDIAFGEVFRRTVGAVDHANFAHRRQGAAQLGGQRGAGRRVGQR